MRVLWPLLVLMFAIGCAAQKPVISPVPDSPDVKNVLESPENYTGRQVRWGGTVASVENRADISLIEVVARELDDDGRPNPEGTSRGRFMVRVKGFVDPVDYRTGRSVTVLGTIAETMTKPIGDYTYRFPVLEVERIHLWEPLAARREPSPAPPWYYDPWYPYSYGPWPYYRPFGPQWPYWW